LGSLGKKNSENLENVIKTLVNIKASSGTPRKSRAVSQLIVWVRRGGVYRVLVGKPAVRRPLGRRGRRWVDNIRTDLQEVGCGHMDWSGLAQDRDRWWTLVSAVMNLRVP
jgi:hypothetical protein